ncbi:MAG: PKD domain-containing protein [Kineosporiaceae bacterium]
MKRITPLPVRVVASSRGALARTVASALVAVVPPVAASQVTPASTTVSTTTSTTSSSTTSGTTGSPTVTSSAASATTAARTGTATTLGSLALPVPSNAIVVSPSGDDTDPGTAAAPLRTVTRAVAVAPSGATIVLRAGEYHEDVDVPSGKKVLLQNWPGEVVWFDGSRRTTAWVADGSRWRLDGWTASYDTRDTTGGLITSASPMAAYPAQLWIDGARQSEVKSLAEVVAGTFYVDQTNDKVWLGSSPSGKEVRVADLPEALYINKGNGSAIRGIGFRRYATPIARMGMVKAYADDVTVSDSVFSDSSLSGLSLNGARATITRSLFERNGQLGLQGNHTDDLQVTNSVARTNNVYNFATNHAAGGMKFTQARRLTLTDNSFETNTGHGLWLDESVLHAVVARNTFKANTRHAMDFEISADLLFVGNTATDNGESALRILESGHVRAWNNTMVSNVKGVDMFDGDRMAADPTTRGADSRYPTPDPLMTWEVSDVEIRNNVLNTKSGSKFAFGYDDARKTGNASALRIATNDNAYWRLSATSPTWTAAWGMYPSPGMVASKTLSAFAQSSGQETRSVEVTQTSNPWPTGGPTGAAVPSDVAALLGTASGTKVRAGAPAAPIASLKVTCTGRTCAADGSASSDPGGSIVSWAWSFGDGSTASGKTASHTYATTGTYTVTLKVTDDSGLTATASTTVATSGNAAPVAAFTSQCTQRTCTLDATSSTDSDGTITAWAWTGGGAPVSGATSAKASITFGAAGSYPVALTVTDDDGATSSTTRTLTITNTAPVASFTSTCGQRTCTLDASGSSDPDGTVTAWAWSASGATVTGGSTATPTLTYSAAGTYTVWLRVTDDDGATNAVSRTVTVTNLAPVASFTTSCTLRTCTFDASGSRDADGRITGFAWTFGDGSQATGATATRTYAEDGTYTVRLVATDDDGGTDAATDAVAVSSTIAQDTFARTETASWGSTPAGAAWSLLYSASSYDVESGRADMVLPTKGLTRMAWLDDVAVADTDAAVTTRISTLPTGSNGQVWTYLVARRADETTSYRLRSRVLGDGSLRVALVRRAGSGSDTVIGTEILVDGVKVAADQPLRMRLSVTGSSPTTLAGKVWAAGTAEPDWQVQGSDSSTALQGKGTPALGAYQNSGNTAGLTVVSFDDFSVTDLS